MHHIRYIDPTRPTIGRRVARMIPPLLAGVLLGAITIVAWRQLGLD